MIPAHPRPLADPFVLRVDEGYLAFGTEDPAPSTGSLFPVLASRDLRTWVEAGQALERPDPEVGDTFWAPEVTSWDGRWWLYYSAGHGIAGHHIRVAVADAATGPYRDTGDVLTPGERFAIDPHPFTDEDGRRYLYFARDVLDGERPGTHLAVMPLASPTVPAGDPIPVLAPFDDWQLYERSRSMYGRRFDWHTLEGPFVVRRGGRVWMTYSGGAWTGDGYAVSSAVADHPLGPWEPARDTRLMRSEAGLVGPGHNSIVAATDGGDVIAFHAWDADRTARRMHLARISFEPDGPRVTDPLEGRP